MSAKTQQLQIRITGDQKARLKRLARAAGQDVSTYVLARALSPAPRRVQTALRALRRAANRTFALAEIGDALSECPDDELPGVIGYGDLQRLSPFDQNYVAAMLETVFASRGLPAAPWLADVQPSGEPWFATDLPSVRMHLLRASPVAFRRRNLFVDATLEDRV